MWNAASDVDFDVATGNGDLWENNSSLEEEYEDERSVPGYIKEWDAWAREQNLNKILDSDFADVA